MSYPNGELLRLNLGTATIISNYGVLTSHFGSGHPFMRKEWYNVNVPSIFGTQVPTLTPANKSAGQSK